MIKELKLLDKQQTALLKIAKLFNDHNIKWALGGSLMLYYFKLVDYANDIDILIAESDIDFSLKVIKTIAKPLPVAQSDEYLTKCFKSFTIDDVNIDIMAGFKIKHSQGVYEFPFNKTTICQTMVKNDTVIPLSYIEDWYIAYLLMSNRTAKINLIETHFNKRGIKYPQLLTEALKQKLPANVESRVKKMLALKSESPRRTQIMFTS